MAEYERGLGEDGGEVQDRGLFGRSHGYGGYDGEAEQYAAEIGGRRPPPVVYEGEGAGFGEYERRPQYERPGMYEGEGGGFGEYERRPPPEVVYEGGGGFGGGYGGAGASDLGTGLVDSNIRTEPDYGTGYGRSDLSGEYLERRGAHGRVYEDGEEQYDEERRHKREAEAAAAAAIGYGLYERHEKNNAEEQLAEMGYDEEGRRKHGHHLF